MRRAAGLQVLADLAGEETVEPRPRTRGDCLAGGVNAARPCPWLGCRHHLAIDVTDTAIGMLGDGGALASGADSDVEAFTDAAIARMARVGSSCVLDEVDRRGEHTLEMVGRTLDVTRERIRQIQTRAMPRYRRELRVKLGSATDQPLADRGDVIQGCTEG